ncbi:MAG: PHP domain-containing protein [Oscillospiraceae bacterium]|nr:PHP domain-containing protein [Oscillospiraceae bacterium]
MLMNLHTHTYHSYDGAAETVADRIRTAKLLGLQVMAITDHVELNRYYPAAHYHAEESEQFLYDFGKTFADSVAETAKEQQSCSGLTLLAGAEIGQMTADVELARKLYRDPRVDIILASVHEMHDLPDFYFLDYSKIDIKPLIDEYFEEALRTAALDCFDVMAHLTYGLRYIPHREEFDITPYYPVIDEIFRTLIANGKALELNGSGLKKAIPYTDPDFTLIRRYRELGGQYLTISTDTHEGAFLGYRLDELEDMARAAGFTALTYYRRHEPVLLPL